MDQLDKHEEAGGLRIGATTSMQVASDLRRRILHGELVPGQRLKIDEIAEMCGVSHMPVRTALQELESEGIVEVHPRRGAEIRSIDADYITSMLDVRSAIEVMLTARCASLIDDEGIAALATLVQDFETKAGTGQSEPMLRANFKLHSFVNGVARNTEALRVLARGRLLIEALRIRFGYGGSRLDTVIREHRQLLEAIAARDVTGARDVAQRHCEGARDELLHLVTNADTIDKRI